MKQNPFSEPPPLLVRLLNRLIPLLYSHFAGLYDTAAWLVSRGRWQQWQCDALGDLPEGRLLEVGCGPGHLLHHLLSRGCDVLGLDQSPHMLQRARRRILPVTPSLHLIRAKTEAIPLPDNHFYGIVSAFPTDYILNTTTLKELHRILHPQGTIVVLPYVTPDAASWWGRLAGWLLNAPPAGSETPPQWMQRFEQAGFQIRFSTVNVYGDVVYRLQLSKR